MLESYFHLEKLMEARGKHYPHIGVTEAGNGLEGRAKISRNRALLLQGFRYTFGFLLRKIL